MDALEFVAKSEWPIVAAVAIWMLRQPLSQMMGRVSPIKLNAWGLQAEFVRVLDKVEALSPESGKATERLELTEDGTPSEFSPSSASPELMVLLAWRRVENALRKSGNTRKPLHRVASDLGISAAEAIQIQELNRLRNQVAHSETKSVTWEEARRFHQLSEQLLSHIIQLRRTYGQR